MKVVACFVIIVLMGKKALTNKEINKIKKLRSIGHSVGEIHTITNKGTGTISRYIKGVIVSAKQLEALRARQGGSKIRKENNIRIANEQACNLLKGIDRENVIILSMLYWAEGHKNGGFEFTNSDGRMIQVYLKIIRSVLKIKDSHIYATVRVFTGMKESECLRFWSTTTNLPVSQIKVRMNDGGTSGRTKYGMCRIRVTKGHSFLKLMHALIDNIAKAYYIKVLPS